MNENLTREEAITLAGHQDVESPVGLNEQGEKRFLAWVFENVKNPEKQHAKGWISAFEDKLMSDSDRRDFEMGQFESASGNPEIFDFTDEDLDFD